MADVKQFAEKAGTSYAWTPEQMFEAAIKDIREGKIQAKAAIIVFVEETSDKRTTLLSWRSKLGWQEEHAYLCISAQDTLDYARKR